MMLFKAKVKVGINFTDGFAARRLQYELLKRKPRSVKMVNTQAEGRERTAKRWHRVRSAGTAPDISLEFLVGNPYLEGKEKVIRRAENRNMEHVFWLFYSQAQDNTPMPEHFRDSKAIISTLTSIESRYPHNTHMIPLGADPDVFYAEGFGPTDNTASENRNRQYLVQTHGFDARAESIEYVYRACRSLRQKQCHIGSDFDELNNQCNGVLDVNYINISSNVTDDEMRKSYNLSKFVSGLRLIEGFEMPVIEGAMCGCRPIVYDLPCYSRWFSDFAMLIPFQGEPDKSGPPFGTMESRISKLVDSIKKVFENSESLNSNEINFVKERFNWDGIIPKVWEAILK